MRPERVVGRDPSGSGGLAVTIERGRIAAVEQLAVADGPYLAPGLIDLQVNGYRGRDLNDGTLAADRLSAMARDLFAAGVTTFLPTLITASRASILASLKVIAAARQAQPWLAAMIPGVHVEGPFIAAEDGPRGAHPLAHVRPPDLAELQEWQSASGGLVGMVTLSPSHTDAPAFIRAAAAQGIHVAIGHTAASPAEIALAVEAGARLSTHLGNGVAATLPRHPNLIWEQLADDRLTASFIADGFHLPPATFRAMLRAKGLDRAILVSDLAALSQMPPGIYDQPIGGRVEVGADGRLSVAGTPYLAGAGRTLAEDVAMATTMAGLTLAEALRLATVNPGRFVSGRGRLEPGAPADLIRFDWEPGATALRIVETIAGGERVFAAG